MHKKIILGLICFGGPLFAIGPDEDESDCGRCFAFIVHYQRQRPCPSQNLLIVPMTMKKQQPGDEGDATVEDEEAHVQSDDDRNKED